MNKAVFHIVTLVSIFLGTALSAQTCTKTIDASTPYIDAANPAFNGIKPGDTVCLQAGNWEYIQLKGFHGTAENPIVFINSGGTVIINTDHYFGIKIGGCSHLVFTGSGDPQQKYGFRILKVSKGAGMGIDDYSTDIEISHVEISHTFMGGVYAKTDPVCGNLGATRDKFVMRNFSFHDNYVHDVAYEGLYIGNSHYTGLTLTCNGHDTTVYPHAMKGVFVYRNLVENTGYDGIQVSSADSDCRIHDNTVNFDSQAGVNDQMSGILIGGGSVCKTYNNKITDGKGDGIDIFGMGNFDVFNNLIVHPGKYFEPGQPDKMKHGIYLGHVKTTSGATLGIYNNTIVSPKSYGIVLSNNELQTVFVKNNLIVDPGKYATDGNSAFIHIGSMDAERVVQSNNYLNANISPAKFLNPNSYNYDLQPTSPAVDYGADLTTEGITFDILNRSRPFHGAFDAGAYECHDPSLGIRTAKALDVETFRVFPNPATRNIHLLIKTGQTENLHMVITDMHGRQLLRRDFTSRASENQSLSFSVRHLPDGNYFTLLFSEQGISSLPIVIKR
jgi:hypothetical protein